jgi:hypothetical protein
MAGVLELNFLCVQSKTSNVALEGHGGQFSLESLVAPTEMRMQGK